MPDSSQLKSGVYFIVRYVPDVVRNEGLNIGVLLYCPEEKYFGCLFTDDFRRIRRVDARADVKLLGALQQDFEAQIDLRGEDLDAYVSALSESLSTAIQVVGPRACFIKDPAAEIEELYLRYASSSTVERRPKMTRLRIKQQLTAAFVHAGLWERLEKRIPAERWTQPGDPFAFDYGYKPDGIIHLIHALSLAHDTQLAKTLVYTLGCVRGVEPAQLTAVVGGISSERVNAAAEATRRILVAAQIHVQPIAEVGGLVEQIQVDLGIQPQGG